MESPAVASLLKRLDETMNTVAPTSHMYDVPSDHSRTLPAVNSKLKRGSTLRGGQRETIEDVYEKHTAPDGTCTLSATELANKLRFAVPRPAVETASSLGESSGPRSLSATVTSTAAIPRVLGTGSLTPADVTARYGSLGRAPPDAEVRALVETVTHAGDEASIVAARTYGMKAGAGFGGGAGHTARLGAETHATLVGTGANHAIAALAASGSGVAARSKRDTVGVLLGASGAGSDFATDYRRSFVCTDEVSKGGDGEGRGGDGRAEYREVPGKGDTVQR